MRSSTSPTAQGTWSASTTAWTSPLGGDGRVRSTVGDFRRTVLERQSGGPSDPACRRVPEPQEVARIGEHQPRLGEHLTPTIAPAPAAPTSPVPRRCDWSTQDGSECVSACRHAQLRGSPVADEAERVPEGRRHTLTDSGTAAEPRWTVPRGLTLLPAVTGLLVSVLALQQFPSIPRTRPARAHPRRGVHP